jgi:lipid kinase YegS
MTTAILIINGKKAGQPDIRQAVYELREKGHDLQVRLTWEYGDGLRYVQEACKSGVDRVIAGGGDGTVNEISHGLALIDQEQRPAMGVLPLGTANDFASCCAIPTEPHAALHLALEGAPVNVDLVQANDRYFINVASAGFGAAVTAETPVELKNFLAGGAYTLMGIVKILNFTPYKVCLKAEKYEYEGEAVVGAICNGRQAGGGQVLARDACINDGIFDVLIVRSFPFNAIDQVATELRSPSPSGEYITLFQSSWLESCADDPVPVNLDGEPISSNSIRFEVLPGAIKLAVPEGCPCVKN